MYLHGGFVTRRMSVPHINFCIKCANPLIFFDFPKNFKEQMFIVTYSGLLSGIRWFETDVSRLHIFPIIKCQAVRFDP